MAKIKEVSSYNGTSWDTPVPIGANDANIDITSSTTNPTDTTATSAGLVDSSVTVVSGDTAASAWTKFNRFRKRVQNAFGNFAGVTLRTAYNTSNTDTSVYTTGVINNYMSNVIGYTGTTAPSAGTVASQLSSLNSNFALELQYSNLVILSGVSRIGGGYFKLGKLVILDISLLVGSAAINVSGKAVINYLPSASNYYGNNAVVGSISLGGIAINLDPVSFSIVTYTDRALIYGDHTKNLTLPAGTNFSITTCYVAND